MARPHPKFLPQPAKFSFGMGGLQEALLGTVYFDGELVVREIACSDQ
ncbi:hypothetical protein Cenrod_0241 [Candidatus Symbiobacter mobilis CR]|uniref:Uncharacterized protein n=1 Tax=Candidatus Symbiobacter mobilis CR TaxID=946483 RepID=U5N7Y9_9BURK|nr:hypothetical protein Cenrod_0241 [Candidatus Symbiobacter mobilis CR]